MSTIVKTIVLSLVSQTSFQNGTAPPTAASSSSLASSQPVTSSSINSNATTINNAGAACNAQSIDWSSASDAWVTASRHYDTFTTTSEYDNTTFSTKVYTCTSSCSSSIGPIATVLYCGPTTDVVSTTHVSTEYLTSTLTWEPFPTPEPNCTVASSDCSDLLTSYSSASSSYWSITSISRSLVPSPESPRCSSCVATGCTFAHGGMDLFYFPVTKNVTRNMCTGEPAGGIENSATVTPDPDTTYTEVTTGAYTVVDGNTFYEGNIYLSLSEPFVQDSCGNTVEPQVNQPRIITMASSDLFSVRGYPHNVIPYSIDYADFNEPTPWSAYVGGWHCANNIPFCSEVFPGNYYPVMSMPGQIRQLDPNWASCEYDQFGIFDPPIALHGVPNFLTSSSAAAEPTPTSAEPVISATPGQTSNDDSPTATSTPEPTSVPSNPEDPSSSVTPQDPASSTTPEDPDSSSTPEDPASSTTPEDPASSTTPEDPVSSSTPEDPDSSSTPEDPTASSTPQDPAASSTPQDPAASSTPQDPAASSTPQDPASSATPQDPEDPAQSANPDPSNPQVSSNPQDPTASVIPGNTQAPSPNDPQSQSPGDPDEPVTGQNPATSPNIIPTGTNNNGQGNPTSPVITIGPTVIPVDPTGGVIIDPGTTLSSGGAPVTISSSTFSIGTGGLTIVSPETSTEVPFGTTPITVSVGPDSTPIVLDPTASTIVLGATTLSQGGNPVTVDDTTLSLGPSGVVVVGPSGTSTVAIPTPVATGAQVVTVGSAKFTVSSGNVVLGPGTTISIDGPAATVSEAIFSVGSSGLVVVSNGRTSTVAATGLDKSSSTRTNSKEATGTGASPSETDNPDFPGRATRFGWSHALLVGMVGVVVVMI